MTFLCTTDDKQIKLLSRIRVKMCITGKVTMGWGEHNHILLD